MSKGYGRRMWKSDLEIVEDCDELEEELIIHMPTEILDQIATLMEEITRVEWMGYFLGEREDGHAYIEELEIPEQRVNGTKAENTELPSTEPIGVVHSHHGMGSSHSHIDDDNMSQEGFSVVVNSDMDFTAHGVTELPCGKKGKIEATIRVSTKEVDDELVEDVRDKMTHETSTCESSSSRKYPAIPTVQWVGKNNSKGDEEKKAFRRAKTVKKR